MGLGIGIGNGRRNRTGNCPVALRRRWAFPPITSVETFIPTLPSVHTAYHSLIYVGPVLHWYRRSAEGHPSFSQGVVTRQLSYDNSRTWTPEEVVYSHATEDVAEVTAVLAPNGDLLLLGALSTFSGGGGSVTSALQLRSQDGGGTFAETTFESTDFTGAWSANDFTQFYGQPFRVGSTLTSDAYFLNGVFWAARVQSTDDGDSWAATGSSQSGYNEVQSIPPDLTNIVRFVRSNAAINDTYAQRTANGGNNWTTPGLFAFGVGPKACQLADGDWVLALGRRNAPGGINLYRIPAAGGGRYLSRRYRAAVFSGDITDCGYASMVQAQGEDFLIVTGYQALATGTYPSAAFIKRIPLTDLAIGPWSETFADLGGVDHHTAIASVSSNRLVINDNSAGLALGATVVLNGGAAGNVSFEFEGIANPNYPTIQLRNISGQPIFWFHHDPNGEWLRGYDGTNIVDPTTPVVIPFNTPTTIRLDWNSDTGLCGLTVNGVSKGTLPKDANYSGEVASISFMSGSTASTGDHYWISNLGQAA